MALGCSARPSEFTWGLRGTHSSARRQGEALAPADDGVKASEKTALVRFFERELMQALTILKMLRKDLSDLKTVTMPASSIARGQLSLLC